MVIPLITVPMMSDSLNRRWMLFVDGENFTIRAQELARKHVTLPVSLPPISGPKQHSV
jgi:hypothetical protein